MKAQLIREV